MPDYDRNEWCTPPDVLVCVRAVMGGIDLDPASSYFAQQTVMAHEYYTKAEDGLTLPWNAPRVFCNPPYSRLLIEKFVYKADQEFSHGHCQQVIMLVNNATDTCWFQWMAVMYPVMFSRKRIRFYHPDRPGKDGPRQGQAFIYMGQNQKRFYDAFYEIAYAPNRFGVIAT